MHLFYFLKEFQKLKVDELTFIYFMVDHRSPFSVYEWNQREVEVKNSTIQNTVTQIIVDTFDEYELDNKTK